MRARSHSHRADRTPWGHPQRGAYRKPTGETSGVPPSVGFARRYGAAYFDAATSAPHRPVPAYRRQGLCRAAAQRETLTVPARKVGRSMVDPEEREAELAQAFADIARQLQAQDSREQTWQQIVQMAGDLLPAFEHAAISLVHRDGRIDTVASSDEVGNI